MATIMREGFAIVYRSTLHTGPDTYLRLAPQATSRRVTLSEATMFASRLEAERYARDFAQAPEQHQNDAEVVPVVEEVVRRQSEPPLHETISNMVYESRCKNIRSGV